MASSTTGIASENASKSARGGERIAVYAATTFLSAFLLFQVQPLIGKAILPWFGGGSAVWTTTMLFFQMALLAGYAYAHFVSSRLSLRRQGTLHIVLLAIAALTIPIIPDAMWKPEDGGDPTLRVLIVLALTVGAPYTLLSATAPLVQRWFTHDHPGVSPYRLYSLSNIGSLLALLTYPILFERFLGLQTQAWLWSVSYVVFAVTCSYLAWRVARRARPDETAEDVTEAGGTAAVTPANVALWLALPACASVVLLATTNQLTQDVASIPLLWVLPLALYLLTFILCFGDDRTYQPLRDVPLLAAGLGVGAFVLGAITMALLWQILLYAGSLFIACFALHGELVRLRPASRHLTAFYLMVSVGGALGGLLVAIAAPALFTGYWEYHLALVATGALVAIARGLDLGRHPLGGSVARTRPLLLGGG
ncbi:MAG: ferrichrome ABC transporter permease, partial [Chloroflexi bacterium]|nr:ferrichrome ABC transporter permease [Chloroflexota bacterium]